MSFICGVCKKPAPAGSRCKLIAVEVSNVEHPHRPGVIRTKREDGKWEFHDDEGGKGTQIKREVKACPNCAEQAAALATK